MQNVIPTFNERVILAHLQAVDALTNFDSVQTLVAVAQSSTDIDQSLCDPKNAAELLNRDGHLFLTVVLAKACYAQDFLPILSIDVIQSTTANVKPRIHDPPTRHSAFLYASTPMPIINPQVQRRSTEDNMVVDAFSLSLDGKIARIWFSGSHTMIVLDDKPRAIIFKLDDQSATGARQDVRYPKVGPRLVNGEDGAVGVLSVHNWTEMESICIVESVEGHSGTADKKRLTFFPVVHAEEYTLWVDLSRSVDVLAVNRHWVVYRHEQGDNRLIAKNINDNRIVTLELSGQQTVLLRKVEAWIVGSYLLVVNYDHACLEIFGGFGTEHREPPPTPSIIPMDYAF
ncbi:hypothetical protein DACRYDRAFT_119425 [Dacryopinax primogenitus]|uniref:Uncharacterized protein n=1 Tax=Dacryopinax primogenitus (strain DJM 731) TaxID=1858805 RepID=M5FPT1_DACPD|nr:uncharacterized protein DACRYDRAFT_119425 [Dacryopinax primogenitus]EJT97293.1 hypothetical protein DACRYDRAFT_119425 [Dacryopinax primogenitus]